VHVQALKAAAGDAQAAPILARCEADLHAWFTQLMSGETATTTPVSEDDALVPSEQQQGPAHKKVCFGLDARE
jgi:hypothetical protein